MEIHFRLRSFMLISVIVFSFWYSPSFGQNTSLSNVNKQTITTYFNEVINTQSLNRLGTFFSRDYIWHQMNGTDVRSSQDSSHISAIKFVFSAIPDIHYTIDDIIAEGDMVAVNATITGTAKSEMFGLPAAQKKVHFKQMFFFRLVNNKITEEWEVVDLDGLKAQLSKQ
jgi:steroid delta-isomerase-like uncharacterized protein